MQFSRREAGSIALAMGLGLSVVSDAKAADSIPEAYRVSGWAMGCQAWTFQVYTTLEAIERTAEAGGKVIEFFPGQMVSKEAGSPRMGPGLSSAWVQKIQTALQKAGLLAVAYGVTGFPNSEQQCREVFDFARQMGLRTITCEPDPAAMDILEKLVKEYDIRIAIHDHPKQPNNPGYRFWDPHYVLSLVKGRDKRMGACADTGHWVRSGIHPVDALRILKGRVLASHLKDLNRFSPSAHDVPYGMGVSNVPAILRELQHQHFDGHISVEYEYNWQNNVVDAAQCIGFVRAYGILER